MPRVEVNGRVLRVDDTGGDGPPVVLSHADDADRTEFEAQIDALSDVYRILSWDRRDEEGDVARGPDGEGWAAAQELFAVMDGLGIERAVLGGASDGGDVILRAALLHPDRVRALLFLDPDLPRDDDDISHRLDELAMPVLVVHGADDAALPVARAMALGEAVSDSRGVVAVSGAQAGAHRDHPDDVNGAIRTFLEGLPA